ncbi:MAG: ABC-F family ATP-binding cassette domain-containing protein [Acidimicrobiia bacterium]|nr:MAG: ABC-F family ATP-binding cassette domain-containing protein [Acidimicrobiia bacterium]
MLLVRNVAIEAGARTLLTDVSFSVQKGDKVGLVGPNGAGKTTLLRMLANPGQPIAGTVTRSGSIGYLAQEVPLTEVDDESALERILTARGIGDLERKMEATRLAMETTTAMERDRLIHRFSRLDDEFSSRGGYVAKAEAKRFAAGLGIGKEELDQPVVSMSGGQRRRVELARILFAESDTLILDEPTNHLDLDAKSWLMQFLAEFSGGVLLVSHDLPLLDAAITSVLAAGDGGIDPYRGNYTFYVAERERRHEQRIATRKRQDAEIARLEQGIQRFKGSTAKMAKRASSWETRVGRMQSDLVDTAREVRAINVTFPQPEPSGKIPLRAENLAKAYGHNVVFVDVDVIIDRGDRLIIMGLNGAGKTTLLRILAGVETPDLGEVDIGYRVSVGYYAQEHEDIHSTRSVIEHMRDVSGLPDRELRGILGLFLLADKVDQEAGTLSGGERTKLALARIVVGRHNVLLLDEPTNNLDPQAKEALLLALQRYEGTVILVSHDAEFVAQLEPTRAIVMPDGAADYFDDSMLELVELA